MGWLCDRVVEAGTLVIADFVCPTPATRDAFQANGAAFLIFVDRIAAGRFADTNQIFVPPAVYDLRVSESGSADEWAEQAVAALQLNP